MKQLLTLSKISGPSSVTAAATTTTFTAASGSANATDFLVWLLCWLSLATLEDGGLSAARGPSEGTTTLAASGTINVGSAVGSDRSPQAPQATRPTAHGVFCGGPNCGAVGR